MSLQTAQLGQLSNINLPTSAPQKRPSIAEQALVAFLTNMGGQLGGRVVDNAFAHDYAPDSQKAGFWQKLGSGPTVDEKTYLFNQGQKGETDRLNAQLGLHKSEGEATRKANHDEHVLDREAQRKAAQDAYLRELEKWQLEQGARRDELATNFDRQKVLLGLNASNDQKLKGMASGDTNATIDFQKGVRAEDKPMREAQLRQANEAADAIRVENLPKASNTLLLAQNKAFGPNSDAIANSIMSYFNRGQTPTAGQPLPAQAAPAQPQGALEDRINKFKQEQATKPAAKSNGVSILDMNPAYASYHAAKNWYDTMFPGSAPSTPAAKPASGPAPQAAPVPPTVPQTGPSGPPTTTAPTPAGGTPVAIKKTKDGVAVGVEVPDNLNFNALVQQNLENTGGWGGSDTPPTVESVNPEVEAYRKAQLLRRMNLK